MKHRVSLILCFSDKYASRFLVVLTAVHAYQFSQYANLIDEYLHVLIVLQLLFLHGLDRILLA